MERLFGVFWKAFPLFSVVAVPSDNSPFSTVSPAFVILLFDDGHSHCREVRSDVPFHGARGLTGHLCVLLLDMSVQIICLFLIGLVGLHWEW